MTSQLFPASIGCPPPMGFTRRFDSVKQFTACTEQTNAVFNPPIKYGFFCVQPKSISSAKFCFNHEKKFDKSYYATHMNCAGGSYRSIIARSDLAQGGIPDYSISEVHLLAKARGVCFYAVTAINAVFLFVLMLVGHPFVLILDPYRRKFHHLVAKVWAILTIAPFYKVEFKGLENLPGPDVPAVYVSNHQSFLDIYTLLTLGRSFKFISKTSIFLFPIIGWAMFLLGVIPLKRMDSRSQLECLKRCMDLIRGGASVFFFPEGTRSKDRKLGTFKKGAFSVAAKTGVPVVPITLHRTGNIMPAGKESLLYPGSVKVVIHRPLESKDSAELCNEARRVIAKTLDSED